MAGYLEVSIKCDPTNEDIVTSYITESLSQGLVTEVSDADFHVKFYLPIEEESRDKVESLGKYLVRVGIARAENLDAVISVKAIDDIDWIKQYQQSFRSIIIDNVVVKSTWDEADYGDKLQITIEPKMAFGTGHHETTQLCVAQLLKDIKPGDKLLDLGCGSGILSILAAKLGASEALGLDIDLAAIENARENVVINQVEPIVQIQFGSMEKVNRSGYYDVVVSNLIKDEIYNLFENFMRSLKTGGVMILSGILTDQEAEFLSFLSLKRVRGNLITRKNEWICCRVIKA
ncbi:MAG: 50S ribosomal protein L11 methyltransferase [candidate division Zixibacteria bacterium]|nr:50S ribosomal protein L11 methyltransferase [candidate division Zixibacteria bacterium]